MKTITTYEDLVQDLIDNKITMVNPNEFKTIFKHHDKISKIEGDIVECGVWRGGFSIFLSYVFQDKNIWVCDSYEGFQPLETAKHQYSRERHTPNYTHNSVGPLGISKVIPDAGSVPRDRASINPRSAFETPLMISVDCGVGIRPALFEVVSAAITY